MYAPTANPSWTVQAFCVRPTNALPAGASSLGSDLVPKDSSAFMDRIMDK